MPIPKEFLNDIFVNPKSRSKPFDGVHETPVLFVHNNYSMKVTFVSTFEGTEIQVFNSLTDEHLISAPCNIHPLNISKIRIMQIGGNSSNDYTIQVFSTELKDNTWFDIQASTPDYSKGKFGGKPRKSAFDNMTVKQLKERCAKRGIKHSGLVKAQLIAALRSK